MAINYKKQLNELMQTSDFYYGMFNLPTKKPHRLCVSDDNTMHGNAWGKLVIEGKTWHEIYDIMLGLKLTPSMISKRVLHETPDNSIGKVVSITNIEYDFEDGMGDEPEALPTNMISIIPSFINNSEDAGNFLSDYITNVSCWCHFGFEINPPLSLLY